MLDRMEEALNSWNEGGLRYPPARQATQFRETSFATNLGET